MNSPGVRELMLYSIALIACVFLLLNIIALLFFFYIMFGSYKVSRKGKKKYKENVFIIFGCIIENLRENAREKKKKSRRKEKLKENKN